MIIRKLFKAETAHIVRKAYTNRCDQNIHGHSYKYELFLESNNLDNAGMVTDFTFVKKYFNSLFDSFDHTTVLWSKEKEEIKEFFKNNFARVIVADWNSTAELQSMFFTYICHKIITYINEKGLWTNNEKNVSINSVIVHETEGGYAKCNRSELPVNSNELFKVEFSEGIMKDWTPEFKEFWNWYIL